MGAGTADTTAITGGCYKWQMVTGAPSWNVTTDGIVTSLVPSWTTGLHARLWIIDPSETFLPLRKTPSQLSADLSSSYSSLGLFPSVTTAPQVKLGEVNFNAEGSYWELLYNTTSADAFTFAITSNHVSLINCFVSDTTIELDVQKFPPTLFTLLTPARTINGQILKVSRDACSSNVGLALTDAYGLNNIVITQSSFLTTSVGKGLATNGGVEAVAIVGFNVLILDSTGTVYVNGTVKATGLPISPPVRLLKGASYCDATMDTSTNRTNHAVGWNDGVGAVFYASTDGGLSFKSVSLATQLTATSAGTAKQRIRDVAFLATYQQYCVMATDGMGVDRILFVDPYSGFITSGFAFTNFFIDGGVKGSSPKIWPAVSGAGEVLFSGDALFYSPNGGKNVFGLTFRDANGEVALGEREFVRQVDSDKNGKIAAITNLNRIFWGKAGFPNLLLQSNPLLENEPAYIFFDKLGILQILSLPRTETTFDTLLVRRSIEPTLGVPNITSCPLREFNVDLNPQYILDVGENMTIHGDIVPKSGTANSFSVMYTNYSLLIAKTTVNDRSDGTTLLPSILSYTLTTILQPKSHTLRGKTEILIRPMSANLACPTTQATTSIVMGCRTSRKLVFRSSIQPTPKPALPAQTVAAVTGGHGPATAASTTPATPATTLAPVDCSSAPKSITLSPGEWIQDFQTWLRGSTSRTVDYDCAKYGKPISAYYGADFIPYFDLYDDGVYTRTVNADVAVWENNGRESYTYALNSGTAGCTSKPQSWIEMVKDFGGDPVDAFGPSNYQPCYLGANTTKIDGNIPYTIFNTTNGNYIVWQNRVDGLFLFTAKVLDPSYSYCELTTHFAIQVQGAPISLAEQIGLVFGLLAGMVILLGLSYFVRLRSRKIEAKVKEEEEERSRGETEESAEADALLWKDKLD